MNDDYQNVLIDLAAPLREPVPNLDVDLTKFIEIGKPARPESRIPLDEVISRARSVMSAPHTSAGVLLDLERGREVAICGGGPSIGDLAQIKTIRKLQRRGARVWSVNKTHDFLRRKNIRSDYACLLDPMPWVAGYIQRPHAETRYLVASQCHPDTIGALRSRGVEPFIWHAGVDYGHGSFNDATLEAEFPGDNWLMIPGPTTVGLRSVLLAHALGFRRFHLFGLDSSMRRDAMHAYPKDKAADIHILDGAVKVRNRRTDAVAEFVTTNHMLKQAEDFMEFTDNCGAFVRSGKMEPFEIIVYGDGLLPTMAACSGWHADARMNETWCGKGQEEKDHVMPAL